MAKNKKTEIENRETKSRKTASGPLREKARTMRILVAAVGTTLKKYSYPGLTVVNIAKEAGLNRKLIYAYFGSLDNLIETYLSEKDFWKSGAKKMIKSMDNLGIPEIHKVLQAQFDSLLKDKAQQKIIHWGLGEKNKVLRKISDQRERAGEAMLVILEKDFKNSPIDIRALLAVQIASIYYLSLHAKSYGTTFCGIDINKSEGKERISKAIQKTIETAYDLGKISK
ncbi:TetR/AcrR family transcriptional regulator [Chryseobacterium sp. MEBOG07]|uniref:TetR/AcrR family transcriptional regulator n=1 Tax=Chryseobacterium sp. MEBOG07 TaxID=2879939 RepID=UPI001F3EAEB3|nr:TetR/AcrR family transcriptional regulator [Chryseobacterium sp. MEBOG07]UKB78618.1 TetR/AcrR family transcriptional regulator [Chryseobacterium sp. MEBOG07]